jgi:hypothetical protein
VPECEAERRIKQTLYVMENDWASGSFDYGKVKLTGRKDDTCACEAGRMSA